MQKNYSGRQTAQNSRAGRAIAYRFSGTVARLELLRWPPYFGSTHPVLNTAKISTCVPFSTRCLRLTKDMQVLEYMATYRNRTGDAWAQGRALSL